MKTKGYDVSCSRFYIEHTFHVKTQHYRMEMLS